MNCTGCGAPLEINQLVCPFCGLHNAVDLLVIRDFRVLVDASDSICPNHCGNLQLLQLGEGDSLTAGFCPECKGLHFAVGSVEALLGRVAKQVREINHDRLSTILAERVPREPVRYRSCPICKQGMSRRAFNAHIPVIIDVCHDHGTWLDGGEFSVLAEWTEAGGEQMKRLKRERAEASLLGASQTELAIARASLEGPLSTSKKKQQQIRSMGDIPIWIYLLIISILLLISTGVNWVSGGALVYTIAAWFDRDKA